MLRLVLGHPDISHLPSAISFTNAIIGHSLSLVRFLKQRLSELAALYLHPLFGSFGLRGYSIGTTELNEFAPKWHKHCSFIVIWQELHHLSGDKTPFIPSDYHAMQIMADDLNPCQRSSDDVFFPWTSHIKDPEDIVKQITLQVRVLKLKSRDE